MSEENGNDQDENQSNTHDADDGELTADPSDQYERQEELGSGGLGTVYRATQHRLSRDVAIKEVRNIFEVFADLDRDEIVDRFADVTERQAGIAHPNVARVFDLETDEEYPYAVSEFAENGTLRNFIDDESRRLRASLKYFLQVLGALSTAHEADLVHGGIKPENVLVDDAGNAVVTDFGHSGVVDVSEGSNQVYVGVGTVNYMPPEQFEDPTAATEVSDVYSAGIMFYEMLTGKVPGRRSPMPSSVHDDVPTAIDDIFDRMTTDRVEDRYESVDSVLDDIYASTPILNLLDRQSAVLFYGNPLEEEGDFDGGEVAAGGEASPVQSGSPEDSDPEPDNRLRQDAENAPSPATDRSEPEPAAAAQEGDPEPSSPEEAVSPESEPADTSEEDEVLEKLEDYGELFEEED